MKSIEIQRENSDRVCLPLKLYWAKQIKSQVNNLLSEGAYMQNSCLSRAFVSVPYSDLVLLHFKCVILDLLSCLLYPFG